MPTPSSPMSSLSAQDLLGGNLPQQLADETEEQRRKRLQLQQQRMAMGPAAQTLGMGVS